MGELRLGLRGRGVRFLSRLIFILDVGCEKRLLDGWIDLRARFLFSFVAFEYHEPYECNTTLDTIKLSHLQSFLIVFDYAVRFD